MLNFQKISDLKCAEKTRAKMSSAKKSLCWNVHHAKISTCWNVHGKKFPTWNVPKEPVPNCQVPKCPPCRNVHMPKRPRQKILDLKCALMCQKIPVPKNSCAEMSTMPKYPSATRPQCQKVHVPKCLPCRNIHLPKCPPCRNVHVSKCLQCWNLHVPKHPRRWNVYAEMSIAEMSGAEMSQRQIKWLYSEKATKFENISQVYFELLSNDNRNCEIFSYYCGLLG